MPIKNFWSLEAGEAMFAEQLQQKVSGLEVFFPIKDIAVDLLAVKDLGIRKPLLITFQVKESRAFEPKGGEVFPYQAVVNWFTLDARKLTRFQHRVQFHVFVCSRYDFEAQKKVLVPDYLIVPTPELIKRLTAYKGNPEKRWFLYFCVEPSGRCLEWRGINHKNMSRETGRLDRDFTQFRNNWSRIAH
jgi:hypothetical protein